MSRKSLQVAILSCLVAVVLITAKMFVQPPQLVSADSSTLLVGAAASLQPALREIELLYNRSSPTPQVRYNFGSSGALQQQIVQGAPIDIFMSAASKQMDELERQNLLEPQTRKNLLTNTLVLVTSKQKNLKLPNFQQLVKPEIQRIAVGEPRSVPVGQYAFEVFQNLGILERVRSKLVLGNNVRAVLASIETGNADAGIVYISDAKSSDKVVVSAIAPAKLHTPIVYPIAILKSSKAIESAKKYREFLQTQPARVVFKKYGFGFAT